MEAYKEELYHYGIQGQKWGIRRFQNEDGTLTEKGIARYSRKGVIKRELNATQEHIAENKRSKMMAEYRKDKALSKGEKENAKRFEQQVKDYDNLIKEGESITKDLLKVAERNNYKVESKEVKYYANAGNKAIASSTGMILGMTGGVVGGLAGAVVIGGGMSIADAITEKVTGVPSKVEGTKYKVKKQNV